MSTIPNFYNPDAPEALVAAVREFVAACEWKTATTDRSEHPHSYCMVYSARAQGLIVGYSRMTAFIDQFGFQRAWRNRFFRSVDLDGFSYWLMEADEKIVNRKPQPFGGWNARQPNLPAWA